MNLGQQYLGVLAVMCLLGTALWWLRRRGFASAVAARRSGRRMETLERLPLGPQHALYLVRIGRTVAVVACSQAGCSLLRTVAIDEDAAGGRA
jgi:flagellar biogenesis protein FliO